MSPRAEKGRDPETLQGPAGPGQKTAPSGVSSRAQPQVHAQTSEPLFRHAVAGVKDYAVFLLDPRGFIRTWNAGAERIKGYSEQEILGKHFSIFYPPDATQQGTPAHLLAQAAETGQAEEEGWRIRKDGSRFWAAVVLTAIRDDTGALRGFAKLTSDLTERRQKEEILRKANEELELRVGQRTTQLTKLNDEMQIEIRERIQTENQLLVSLAQLRELGARLQRVREEERAHIAREIHDELGQACTALKMDLATILRRMPKNQGQKPLANKVESAIKLVDSMIRTLRRIAAELRPSTLDDLGLTAAMEWQAQEFQSRTGIPCRMDLPAALPALNPEASTAFFRIFQETLTNISRHAAATHVTVRLARAGEDLMLQVTDDGKGFQEQQPASKKSLGLLGMRERAVVLGGDFHVQSHPGKGTTVTVRIPLHESRQRESGT
jgi:PAS domain S-box-containing protein